MEEKRLYYPASSFKFIMVFYNLAVLIAGLATSNDMILSFILFMGLIGIQFHFTAFEDLRDANWLNRLDLALSIGTLVVLFCKFFILTAV